MRAPRPQRRLPAVSALTGIREHLDSQAPVRQYRSLTRLLSALLQGCCLTQELAAWCLWTPWHTRLPTIET